MTPDDSAPRHHSDLFDTYQMMSSVGKPDPETDPPASVRGNPARPDTRDDLPPTPIVGAHSRPGARLPDRLIASLSAHARMRTYRAGRMIVQEGDPADSVYLLLEGKARGFLSDDSDRRLVLGDVGPGEYFGETMIDGGERCTSGVAVEDCRIAVIPRQAFLRALSTDAELEMLVLRKFALRVRAMTEFVRRLALADTHERVLHFLHEMVLARGDVLAPLTISQQEIGNRVGATRSMVNRVLKGLEHDGVLTVSPDGISLRQLPRRLGPYTTGPARLGAGTGAAEARPAAAGATAGQAREPRRFTSALPPDLIDEIAQRGTPRRYRAGATVIREGEPVDAFRVITRGRLRAVLSSPEGRVFHLGELAAGEYFGETMVVENGVWGTTISAVGACELIRLEPAAFFDLVRHRSDFTRHIAVKLSRHLRLLTHQARSLALQDVIERTHALLLDLSDDVGGARLVRDCPSQQAIGERVGASRSMINRVMRELTGQGLVEQRDDGLLVRPARQP